jgi:hypothetical protein
MRIKKQNTIGSISPAQYLAGMLIGFLAVVFFSIIVLSMVPPVSRDALTHHLAVPKLYLEHGGMYEIPSLKFSYYPMNLDLIYMIPLYFGNDIVPKFIHFAFALLTAWLIFCYLRKRLNAIWAGGGALFFLSLPIIVKLSITVYVDLGLVFFSTASLMSLFKWRASRFQLKYLILSAFCCGLALGVKYNGLIVLFLLTVFVPLLYKLQANPDAGEKNAISIKSSLKRQLRAVGLGILFCLIALMVFSPWMIRNYIWKDNPVYPLYNRFFNTPKTVEAQIPAGEAKLDAGDQTSNKPKTGSTKWGPLAIRKLVYNESWWEIALIPVRIFFQGRDDNPRYFDGKLNPFLFLLPIFAFFQLKMNPEGLKVEKKILLSFAILFILYAYFKTDMRIRYIAPVIPPLVILATFGLYQIHQYLDRHWLQGRGQLVSIAVVIIAGLVFIFNGRYIIHQFKLVDPISYISGRIDRDAYITRIRPEYAVLQYANRHLAADARLLVLFMGNRRYYSDRELIFSSNLFRKIVKKVDSAEAILRDLNRRGFSHLLIRYDIFNNWTDKQFSDEEKRMLKVFFARDAKPVLSENGYGLFELIVKR